jgi:hypothetical protein
MARATVWSVVARINAELAILLLAVSCADPPADDESFSFTGATAPMDATETTTAGPATETGSTASSAGPSTSGEDDNNSSGDGSGSSADTSGAAPTDPFECEALGDAMVFCSDFEEGDLSVWDDADGNPPETNTLLEHEGPFALAGNHVGRIRVPEGRGGADFVKVLPSTHDRVYARWYIAYEDGFDFTAPNHGGGLHAGSRDYLGQSGNQPNGADWFGSWLEYRPDDPRFVTYTYYRGMYQDCADPAGSCWGDTFPCMTDEGENYCEQPQHRETVVPPLLEAGRWYCVEMMMDAGTPSPDGSVADGQLDFWIDGVAIGPWTDLWLRTDASVQLSLLWLSLFHHEEHSVEGVMYDHVVVSTDRIGCL